MLQNVLLTAVTPLCNTNEIYCWENRPFSKAWPDESRQKAKSDSLKTIKKKQKRSRTAFSTEQLRTLEITYNRHKYIDIERRRELSNTLNIGEKCIKIWFQNRRMKEKKESSESSSESSGEVFQCESPSTITSSSPEQKTNEGIPVHNEAPIQYQMLSFPVYNNNEFTYGQFQPLPQSAMPQTDMFYQDRNVYPTQYYPNVSGQYCNYTTQNYVQFPHYNGELQNYWSSSNFDLN